MKELTIPYFSIEYVLKKLKKYPYEDLIFKKELSVKESYRNKFLFFRSRLHTTDKFYSEENEEKLAIDFCEHYDFPYEVITDTFTRTYYNKDEQTLVKTIIFTVKSNQYKAIEQLILSDYQKKTEDIINIGKVNAAQMLSLDVVNDTAVNLFPRICADTVVAGRKAKSAEILITELEIRSLDEDLLSEINTIINIRNYNARPLLSYEQKAAFLTAVLIKMKENNRDKFQGLLFLEKLDVEQTMYRILLVTNENSY